MRLGKDERGEQGEEGDECGEPVHVEAGGAGEPEGEIGKEREGGVLLRRVNNTERWSLSRRGERGRERQVDHYRARCRGKKRRPRSDGIGKDTHMAVRAAL